ncbi:MAG: AraC family transcriptional regulator [Verrucomicrobiota bacterium]
MQYLYFLIMQGFKHFFPVPPIDSPALTIRGIGVQEHMPSCIIDRPHGTRVRDYLFMLFYDQVAVGAGKKIMPQPAETMMIWTPGRTQYYGNREHPYNHTWIHCDGTLIRSLLKHNRLPLNKPFRLSDPAVMERHLLAIYQELTSHARPDTVIVRNIIENMLREIARIINSSPPTAGTCPPALLKVRHYIEAEYSEPITLPQLAIMAHMSVPHFCLQFKKHFKTSPIAYLIRQRMHQAAYFLQDKNLKVSTVAQQVGYDDLFYFSKLFKKHYGASPRALRQMAAGK